MPAYDDTLFHPPAPMTKITLRNPSSGEEIADIQMLLDTGADMTLLPRKQIERLGIQIDAERGYQLSGFDGTESIAPYVEADIRFLTRYLRGRYLLIEQDWGIIGRDVLNHETLVFDGPALTWRQGE